MHQTDQDHDDWKGCQHSQGFQTRKNLQFPDKSNLLTDSIQNNTDKCCLHHHQNAVNDQDRQYLTKCTNPISYLQKLIERFLILQIERRQTDAGEQQKQNENTDANSPGDR